MSSTAALHDTATRIVLPASDAVWECIKVDACRTLLSEWSQAKVHYKMKKPTAVAQLVENGVSVDFARISRWREEGVIDPGAEPQGDSPLREWALDRAFLQLVAQDKIGVERLMAVKGLGLPTPPGETANEGGLSSRSLLVDGQGSPPEDANSPRPVAAQPPLGSASSVSANHAGSDANAHEPAFPSLGQQLAAVMARAPDAGPGAPAVMARAPAAGPGAPAVMARAPAAGPLSPAGDPGAAAARPLAITAGPGAPAAGPLAIAAGPGAPAGGPAGALIGPAGGPVGGVPPLPFAVAMPQSSSANDPYWPILGRAIAQYGFTTEQGGHPVTGPHGLPLPTNGRVRGSGRIAIFGKDRRNQNAPQAADFFAVLEDVRVSFLPGNATVTASSHSIMNALATQPMMRDGEMFMPVIVGHQTMHFCIGTIVAYGVTSMAPDFDVPLFLLPPSGHTLVFQSIALGTELVIRPTVAYAPAAAPHAPRGRARAAARARKPKKEDVVNLALAKWIREFDGGAFMDDPSIKLLRSTKDSLFPWAQLIKQIEVIKEMSELGHGDASAPAAARGKKVTHIAISYVVRRSVGWVRNALHVHRLLTMYGNEKKVRALVKTLKQRAVGVKTVLEGLRELVDEGSNAEDSDRNMGADLAQDHEEVVDPQAPGEDYSEEEYVEVDS